jgi:hypothetical protein
MAAAQRESTNPSGRSSSSRVESLGSTTLGALPMPKMFNSSMPSDGTLNNLSEEQKREVDEHNKVFIKASEPG